jgi:hypothetical protein
MRWPVTRTLRSMALSALELNCESNSGVSKSNRACHAPKGPTKLGPLTTATHALKYARAGVRSDAKPVFYTAGVRGTGPIQMSRFPGVAVVEPDHLEASSHEGTAEVVVPVQHVGAKTPHRSRLSLTSRASVMNYTPASAVRPRMKSCRLAGVVPNERFIPAVDM